MSSSLANAVKRKTHKERSQPAARQKYGLLEKHKDYVQRARDFHRKEKTLKVLKRKAEDRNPDEFYFAMQKKKTVGGIHDGSIKKANKYTQEELALMKSQDVKYLTMKEKAEAQKLERLKESLHFIGMAPQNKHTVFVEEAAEAKTFDPAEYFGTSKDLVGRAFNRPKQEQIADPTTVVMPHGVKSVVQMKKAEQRKLAAYKELEQRMKRHQSLARTAAHLAMEKEVASKGRKRKLSKKEITENVGDDGRTAKKHKVFKWKRERKK